MEFGYDVYMQEDEDSVLTKNKKKGGDGEQEIDVVTVQPIPAFCSRCVVIIVIYSILLVIISFP